MADRKCSIAVNLTAGFCLLALVLLACAAIQQVEPSPTQTQPASSPIHATTGAPKAPFQWDIPAQPAWQIQFAGEIDTNLDVDLFELDAFDTDAFVVEAFASRSVKVVCYLNAGAWENWRPDQDLYPVAVIGKDYSGWKGEKWLDIRQIDTLGLLLEKRLDLCRQKGFQAVEFDNVDGYTNVTGFPLTAGDQLVFNRWLAEQAHSRSLAVGLKNDPEQAVALVPYFDFALVEDCFTEGWCKQLAPFLQAGKPVLAIEYTDRLSSLAEVCPLAQSLKISVILKNRNLDEFRTSCGE